MILSRLSRAGQLWKQSLRVLRRDAELFSLPFVIWLLAFVALSTLVSLGAVLWEIVQTTRWVWALIGLILVAVCGPIVLLFLAQFARTIALCSTHQRLAGGDPTLRSSIAEAMGHLSAVGQWTVLILLPQIFISRLSGPEELDEALEFVGEVTWQMVTYLVLPVLVFEQCDVPKAVKRSARLFRENWGATAGGSLGSQFVVVGVVMVVPGAVITVGQSLLGLGPAAWMDHLWVRLAPYVLGFGALLYFLTLGIVVDGVVRGALYVFAHEGETLEGFEASDLREAFTE